jgi:signal transduction histidine kinase
MSRLGLRRRLLLLVIASVVVVVTGLVTGFNLVLSRSLDGNARDLVRSRALTELGTLQVVNNRLVSNEAPDLRSTDTYLWVYRRDGHPVEEPRTSPAVHRAVASLLSGPARYHDVASKDTRLYAAPVLDHGRRVGTVVAGVSLAPYEETRRTALVASAVFGLCVLVFVSAVMWWLLGASLRPVVRMTRQAAAWSENDRDHRFALGPPYDELTELAATLDGLLDRLAASLRRERRFSAELSHELRTPLARVLAESELALRREREPSEYRRTLELVQGNAAQLSRTVDALVAAARYEAGGDRGTADAAAVAAGAAEACEGLAENRQIDVELEEPQDALRLGVEPDLAERILQPVIENACRYSATHVRVSVVRQDSTVVYAVEDDGPGVADGESERIFEPGIRGAAGGSNGNSGAGLGLSLARRLARSVDGDIDVAPSASGARFLIRLPAG